MCNHKHSPPPPATNNVSYHTINIITVNPEYCLIVLRLLDGTHMVKIWKEVNLFCLKEHAWSSVLAVRYF
jgi:hypothetical protein